MDRDAALEQLAVAPAAGETRERMIVPAPRHQYGDADAAPHGPDELLAKPAVGDKVWRGNADRFTRRRDQDLEERPCARGAAFGGSAVHHQRDLRSRRLEIPLVRADFELDIREDLARGFKPVLREGGLQPHGERAGYLDHGIAPGAPALARPDPVVGHADTAHKGHRAVHDEQVAVRAVVEALQRVPGDGLVPAYLASRGEQRVEVALRGEKAAVAVNDQPHAHAAARALLERREHFIGDPATQKKIDLEVNAAPRFADCAQLGGEDLLAVVQHPYF